MDGYQTILITPQTYKAIDGVFKFKGRRRSVARVRWWCAKSGARRAPLDVRGVLYTCYAAECSLASLGLHMPTDFQSAPRTSYDFPGGRRNAFMGLPLYVLQGPLRDAPKASSHSKPSFFFTAGVTEANERRRRSVVMAIPLSGPGSSAAATSHDHVSGTI